MSFKCFRLLFIFASRCNRLLAAQMLAAAAERACQGGSRGGGSAAPLCAPLIVMESLYPLQEAGVA